MRFETTIFPKKVFQKCHTFVMAITRAVCKTKGQYIVRGSFVESFISHAVYEVGWLGPCTEYISEPLYPSSLPLDRTIVPLDRWNLGSLDALGRMDRWSCCWKYGFIWFWIKVR
jgi:hypothetical protein